MQRIYLDNNATTELDPRVFKAMLAELKGPPSNPSSVHWCGRQAAQKLLKAREQTAAFFQARPEEIIFTSGGTESNNLFLRGLGTKGHLITTKIEHSSIYKTVQALENQGLAVTYLPVGLWGAPLPEHLAGAIRPDTRCIALSAANNETGVKLDIEAFAQIALERNIPLLIDAVCWIGKEKFPMHPGITAVSLSGHKFHAPKGVGALFLRPSCKLTPLFTGGSQENLRRAGTENLAGILGLAEALQILMQEQDSVTERLLDLRDRFECELLRKIPALSINGEGRRIANTSNLVFPGLDGETLLIQLDLAGVAASHGTACASKAMEPSRILLEMGVSHKNACNSLRFSFGRGNTQEEVDAAIEILVKIYNKIVKS